MIQIDDGFAAYCFDEACCYILSQLDEGKRPFFGRTENGTKSGGADSGNAQTIEMMKKLGAEVRAIGN